MSIKKRRRWLESFAPLTLQELQNLPTPRILAYLRTLQKCENSRQESDMDQHEASIKGAVFKNNEEWKTQYKLVKDVLATRTNIEKN